MYNHTQDYKKSSLVLSMLHSSLNSMPFSGRERYSEENGTSMEKPDGISCY